MKKIFQKLALVCLSVCSLFLTFSCGSTTLDSSTPDEMIPGGTKYNFENDISAYTEDEHRFRIKERIEEMRAERIEDGVLLEVDVEILYSFDYDQPRYFLVDYTFSFKDPRLRYQHIIGVILNDEYYFGAHSYGLDCHLSRSQVWNLGYVKAKKYFGWGILAVETENGELLQIYNAYLVRDPVNDIADYEKACEQKILSREDYKTVGFVGDLHMYYANGFKHYIVLSPAYANFVMKRKNQEKIYPWELDF